MSYLLRLVVPDRPGSLGAVATALGHVGVDILSVEVLERGPGYAVDDIVVELPGDRLADSLITAALSVPGVEVESLRPFAGPLDTHRELELLDDLARSEGHTTQLLAELLPRVHHSGWAVVLRARVVGKVEVLAAHDAAPSLVGVDMPWLPMRGPRLLPSEDAWLPERWREMAIEMMAAPLDRYGRVVLLGRSGGPAFRRSELLRLTHLVGLAATVLHLPPA